MISLFSPLACSTLTSTQLSAWCLLVGLFTLVTAFPIGIILSQAKKFRIFSNDLRKKDMNILVTVGTIFGILSIVLYTTPFAFFFSLIGGFTIGSLTIRFTMSFKKLLLFSIGLVIFFMLIIFLLKITFGDDINRIYLANNLILTQIEATFIVGIVIGQIANMPLRINVIQEKVSWGRVFWGFFIGIVAAYIFALLVSALSFLTYDAAALIGTGIGISVGQGGILLKKYRTTSRENRVSRIIEYDIMWQRLPIGIYLGLLYCLYLEIVGISLYPFIPQSSTFAASGSFQIKDLTPVFAFVTVYFIVIIGITIGFLVGCIQAFGPRFQAKIEGWPVKALAAIGLIFTIISILLTLFYGLFASG